ncbi:6-pyruvoyl tetrahydropterin synthase [Thermoplasmatales archaeon SG8-52-4]|nr:MAG: 6-pyruvoyl tetrahydropterin synthase [Thermoplasmatales archaeon SG8-52-4]
MSSCINIDGWKSNIRFSSAHVIPEYEKCGRLHGHTYALHATIIGEMDNKGIIIDFSLLKEILREIVNELDHKILVPKASKLLKIEKFENNVKISLLDKYYVFPIDDCVFLPLNSTSAENLASYILNKLIKKLSLPKNIESIEIGVDEGYGQGTKVSRKI